MNLPRLPFAALALAVAVGASVPPAAVAAEREAVRLSERWDEKRAAALLDKAAKHVEAKGAEAVHDFNRQGAYIDRDLYVYALDTQGVFLASGGSSAALIGDNVLARTDAAGKAFFADIVRIAKDKGEGHVEYRWLNPLEQREEPKVTLFRKVGEVIVAVGFYAPRATPAQARNLLERAAEAVSAGAPAAAAEFQRVGGDYLHDDLYVFLVDMADGRVLANGASPALVGRDGREVRDPKGKAIIADMINIAQRKGEGELDYAWRNPTTGKVESKHSYFRVVDGKLVGVGYYTR